MQTFLPYPDFEKTVKCLDYRRLGKQRVEAYQILNILIKKKKNPKVKLAWENHPAVLMWKNHETALAYYMNYCIEEWINRGYNNSMNFSPLPELKKVVYPKWFNNKRFHAAHRSNLLRKDKKWYKQFKWKEKNNLEYYWPK